MTLTQEQREKLQQLFQSAANGVYTIKRNVVVEGRRCAIVFVAPARPAGYVRGVRIPAQPEKVVGGITEEKYNENKDEIERMWSEATDQARKRELRTSWITLALAGRLLVSAGTSWETGLAYYQLSVQVPQEVWSAVSSYFQKVERGGDLEHPASGWVVIGRENAEKVLEKLLDIAQRRAAPEHRAAAQELLDEDARRRDEAARAADRRAEQQKIIAELEWVFRQRGEKPAGSWKLDGEVINDPLHPCTPYGGGRWFVIQPDAIWLVENNGGDGDDWSLNNVVTGGAGAIGVRIPYDERVTQMIRELRNDN